MSADFVNTGRKTYSSINGKFIQKYVISEQSPPMPWLCKKQPSFSKSIICVSWSTEHFLQQKFAFCRGKEACSHAFCTFSTCHNCFPILGQLNMDWMQADIGLCSRYSGVGEVVSREESQEPITAAWPLTIRCHVNALDKSFSASFWAAQESLSFFLSLFGFFPASKWKKKSILSTSLVKSTRSKDAFPSD